MRVEEKGNTIHLKDTTEKVADFLTKIEHEYNSFAQQHIIIDLLHINDVSVKDIEGFKKISKKHKKAKKSFIIVAQNINHNEVSDDLQVVPTILEAHDIIEIEDIERDLGF